MSLWENFNKKHKVMQEQYGTEALIQTYNILEFAESRGHPSWRYCNEGVGEVIKILEEFKTIFNEPASFQDSRNSETYVFVNNQSYLSFQIQKSKKSNTRQCEIDLVTVDKAIYDAVKNVTSGLIEDEPASNNVFALVSTQRGLALSSLGTLKQTLNPLNYKADAVASYEHIKSCIGSKDPCGRLSLLQGAPGTGKSYMIRSLVSEVQSTFVVVGTHMIADLSGPAILPLLMQNANGSKPITFILEDADVALTVRKSGDMPHLSGLLNLGDGLLGEMLDIRIIATTNAERLDLDAAITRPGRMCKHIEFNKLSVKEAASVYSSLVKKPTENINTPLTLAEVYRMARQDGWAPPKVSEKREGQYL